MPWTVTLRCRRRLVVVVFREEVDGENGLQRCGLRSTVPCSTLPTVPTVHCRVLFRQPMALCIVPYRTESPLKMVVFKHSSLLLKELNALNATR
jgi:hypothetical protein